MKKIYLGALLIALSSGTAFGQVNTKPYAFGDLNTNTIKPTQALGTEKALGIEIWLDDFSTGANWTIDNDGQTGADYGWSIDATADGWFTAPNFTGGFAELANGDPSPGVSSQALDVIYTMTSIALDVPNLPANTPNTDQVLLEYKEFGARYNDLQEVQISTDGSTWTTIRDNTDHYGVLSGLGGSAYPNPETVSINLAPYITGNASSVQIRYRWTTNFPASAANSNVWIAYGWYIDDVRLITNPDNDISAVDSYWGTAGLNYSMIPLSQVQPIDFEAVAFNNGISTQNNVTLEVDINAGAWTGVSPSNSIPAGVSDTLTLSTQYTPPGLGSYSFTWGLTQDEIDDVPTNNDLTDEEFEVTDFIYAMDHDNIDGSTGNGGFGYETGNFYDIWSDDMAYYIDVKLHNTTTVNSTIYGIIYAWDGTQATIEDALSFVQQTNYHTVSSQDLSGVLSLPLLAPTQLTAAQNTYFVVIVTDGNGGNPDVQVATSGEAGPGFSLIYAADDDTWYSQPSTPIVRLNLDGTAWNVNELSNDMTLNVYPNPSTDEVNVDFNLVDASDVKIEVMDMAGNVVELISNASKAQGVQKTTINTSNYTSGMYFINVTTQGGVSKSKFVKK